MILVGAISTASAASYTFSSIGSEHANVDGTGAAARFGDPHGSQKGSGRVLSLLSVFVGFSGCGSQAWREACGSITKKRFVM